MDSEINDSLYDFIKNTVFTELDTLILQKIQEINYFADLKNLELKKLEFTVIFDGAP